MNSDLILRRIGKEIPNAFLLQVGAMDGTSFDDFCGYVDLFKWKGLWVEPMPEMYERLLNHYSSIREDYDSLLFENSAISDYDGDIKFIRIPPKVVDDGKVEACFNGMSAVYPPRNGLGSEFDRKTVEEYAETLTVPCLTMETLVAKHNVSKIDLLCIDAEGHDWRVFKHFDLDKYKPKFIKIEFCNLEKEEQDLLIKKLEDSGYEWEITRQDIIAVDSEWQSQPVRETEDVEVETEDVEVETEKPEPPELTIVTGIWDLNRAEAGEGFQRSFDHYVENFIKLLKTDVPMIIFIEKEHEHIVWENRTAKNTNVIIKEVEDFKKSFDFYDRVQEIRKDEEWIGQAGWLRESTQATLEFYNPMVMSKMFMLNDARIRNPFDTDHFAWIDGGITNTVHEGYFTYDKVFDKVAPLLKKFFFLCFPYDTQTEIHGFKIDQMNRLANENVNRVARGGFFGGHKKYIQEASARYYDLLAGSLKGGYMGTEESVFTIMTYLYPETYKHYMIEGNGLINKFFEDLKTGEVEMAQPDKVNFYVAGFNFPEQFQHLLQSYEGTDFLDETEKFLINNSTDRSTDEAYQDLCDKYNFHHLKQNENLGICGARQFAAEHFAETGAKYMMFFEDDMLLRKDTDELCKNGFAPHSQNLFENLLSIMDKEGYDFLKWSFSEFYGDNSNQWAWYNVPQHIREEYWPDYNKLPEHGLDPNCPLTNFKSIKSLNGVPYAEGDVYYCNWPQILTQRGSAKMFLDTTWATPHEQTWMSHIFQLSKTPDGVENKVSGAILLASPILHDRIHHYKAGERVESINVGHGSFLDRKLEKEEAPRQITGYFNFEGLTAMQHEKVIEVFRQFLTEVRPKRVLEIGTAGGGLTLFVRRCLNELGLGDSLIKTIEVQDSDYSNTLWKEDNLECLTGLNIFDEKFPYTRLEKPEVVEDFIKGDGVTVVLCDGGNKITEFNEIAPLIKEGDIIMAHDYVDTLENFEKNFVNKVWNWREIGYEHIRETCEQQGLVPFSKESMDSVVWGCFKKS